MEDKLKIEACHNTFHNLTPQFSMWSEKLSSGIIFFPQLKYLSKAYSKDTYAVRFGFFKSIFVFQCKQSVLAGIEYLQRRMHFM